ncbi:hypothetical protein HYC85_029116 [Camellia sinensis]|uniref:Uncharacterized protein n=1 Tax=Camellia sinensis TaxID=4442 RepID=A0A7J7FX76_CAMSI|nr:hypothetical protein HYC85_029116 [Camellia sinensis]
MERGYLKPFDPQPLPNLLPARYNPTKYYVYHQQRGHGTDHCYRLCHEVQNLIDNRTIAPPLDPKDQISPAHLNRIHILSSTYNPSIFITPAHLPKPEVFIPESTELCMMDALESQSSQTHLASGILAPSSTTSHARSFTPKGFPIFGRVAFEEGQSLGKVVANGKNKIVDGTFATQNERSLNQGTSREKGRHTRNVPFSSNPTLGRDRQSQLAPTNPSAGASIKTPQTSKCQPRGQRVYMTLSKAFQILVGQGHLKPLEPRPLLGRLPASHDTAKYCVFHQQTGHGTDSCYRLHHEIQDLIDNKVIVAPGSAKSIDTRSVNLGDNVII